VARSLIGPPEGAADEETLTALAKVEERHDTEQVDVHFEHPPESTPADPEPTPADHQPAAATRTAGRAPGAGSSRAARSRGRPLPAALQISRRAPRDREPLLEHSGREPGELALEPSALGGLVASDDRILGCLEEHVRDLDARAPELSTASA